MDNFSRLRLGWNQKCNIYIYIYLVQIQVLFTNNELHVSDDRENKNEKKVYTGAREVCDIEP